MSDDTKTAAAETGAKAPMLTRPELVRRVQAATGSNLKDVQAIVRATLDVMGTALRAHERLNLPPFGAARVLSKPGQDKGPMIRIGLRELEEKERPAKADRPAAAGKTAKAAKRGGKQGLAAKSEAE